MFIFDGIIKYNLLFWSSFDSFQNLLEKTSILSEKYIAMCKSRVQEMHYDVFTLLTQFIVTFRSKILPRPLL